MPGANSANSSCPKYEPPAPALTIRLSYSCTTTRPSGRVAVTRLAFRSKAVTSPISTSMFLWFRKTSRVAGAIAPPDRMPVATWYRSGWNRWWLVRSISVTSIDAPRRNRAANSPPKPDPTITTRWSLPGSLSVTSSPIRGVMPI